MKKLSLTFLLILFALPAKADFAINMLGMAKHFGSHPEVINERHDMLGVEYKGFGYAHFKDSYGYPNNAFMYHLRHDVGDYIKAGITAAYVHRYDPRIGAAPELIFHVDGAGIRVICLPNYKDRIGFCAFNLRFEIP